MTTSSVVVVIDSRYSKTTKTTTTMTRISTVAAVVAVAIFATVVSVGKYDARNVWRPSGRQSGADSNSRWNKTVRRTDGTSNSWKKWTFSPAIPPGRAKLKGGLGKTEKLVGKNRK